MIGYAIPRDLSKLLAAAWNMYNNEERKLC